MVLRLSKPKATGLAELESITPSSGSIQSSFLVFIHVRPHLASSDHSPELKPKPIASLRFFIHPRNLRNHLDFQNSNELG